MNQNGEPIPFDRAVLLGGDGKRLDATPHITAEMCMANASHGVPPDQIIAMALVGVLDQMEQRGERARESAAETSRMADALASFLEHQGFDGDQWKTPPPDFPPDMGGVAE